MSNKWMEIIHSEDAIYEAFPIDQWPKDGQGWGFESPIFEEVIKFIKPKLIIEVGSWKGASALAMARFLKKYELQGEIICVDSWLGTAGTWMVRDDVSMGTPRLHGRPNIYMQFMANVIHEGHTDTIVPLSLDSLSGAQFLSSKGAQADAIYIDAGHDYGHCLNDITAFWNLLRPGGLMFGDDYSMAWIGVIRAVHTFSESKQLPVYTNFPGKWMMQKP